MEQCDWPASLPKGQNLWGKVKSTSLDLTWAHKLARGQIYDKSCHVGHQCLTSPSHGAKPYAPQHVEMPWWSDLVSVPCVLFIVSRQGGWEVVWLGLSDISLAYGPSKGASETSICDVQVHANVQISLRGAWRGRIQLGDLLLVFDLSYGPQQLAP